MIKFEKMYILTIKNLQNFGTYYIIKISLVLQSTYIIPGD